MADELGIDLNIDPDLPNLFTLNRDKACLAADLLHRLQTTRGQLFYDPNYGLDIRRYLGKRFKTADAFRSAAEISAELKADPRVDDASATVTFDFPSNSLTAEIQIDSAQGPFTLTILATADLVKLTRIET